MNLKRAWIIIALVLFSPFLWKGSKVLASDTGINDTHVIVVFKNHIDAPLIEENGGSIDQEFKGISSIVTTIPQKAVAVLQKNPEIQAVQVDHNVYVEGQVVGWGLKQTQVAPLLSTNLTGKGVKVAVLDTGIDTNHPDLHVTGGTSVLGYTSSYNDDNGHGTHVAGIIGALNNNSGVVGVAPGVQLYAVKVLDQTGAGKQSDVISGIEWAIENHMNVINLSLSGGEGSLALQKEMKRAYDKGILIVGAAGNLGDYSNNSDSVGYPARYNSVIAVTAVNDIDQHPNFASAGPTVELSAPGVNVESTYNDGKYATETGTSMAAPFVTGVIALYKQMNPNATPDQIRSILRVRAEDLGVKGRDPLFGYGLVQAPNTKNVDITDPTAPTNIKAVVNYTNKIWTVQLKWDPAKDNVKIAGYNVYRNGKKIATVQNTNFDEIAHCSVCHYQIKSIDEAGNQSSYSKEDSVQVTDFTDVQPDKWYAAYVHTLFARKIVNGFPDGQFRPNHFLSRADALTMLGRQKGVSGTLPQTQFPDVKPGYAAGFIQWSYNKGIVNGETDGKFHPNEDITRSQVAFLISRAYQLPEGTCNHDFSDVSPKSRAFNAIESLCSAHIVKGYSNNIFGPQKNISRAEFSAVLVRASDLSK